VAREPGTIQITTIPGAMVETMNRLARSFEQANPDIKVQVLVEPEGGAFEALIAAGNQPDLIVGALGSMHTKYAAMDVLVPLDGLPGAEEIFARVDEVALHQDLGQHYLVPLGLDVQGRRGRPKRGVGLGGRAGGGAASSCAAPSQRHCPREATPAQRCCRCRIPCRLR
jgi:hypothetical protein